MNEASEETVIDVEPTTSEVVPALLAYQCIDALKNCDDAAYRVYLSLACRFGVPK